MTKPQPSRLKRAVSKLSALNVVAYVLVLLALIAAAFKHH